MSLVSTHLTTVRTAVTTAGAKFPPPVTQAIAERDSIVAAAKALPAATIEAIADAIAAALLDNRDPFADDNVQRLVVAQVAAGSTGDAVAYTTNAAAERRVVAAIAGNVDAILDPLIAAANRLGAVLATAHQVIGDHDLDDHAGILAMGENAARAWADARTALQQLRVITAGWLALAELTGFASTSVDPILRFADVTVDEYDHHGRRPDVWQLIRAGVTIAFADGTMIRARTAAIAAERGRRQARADGEFQRQHQRQAGIGIVA